jgi:hypothetical protein
MSGRERRKTERLMLAIPVRVLAFSANGEFTEDSSTVQVNRDGARIVLTHRVAMDDTLRIINLHNLAEADFRVVGPARLDGGQTAEWGVECIDPGRNIWGVDFPPPLDPGDPRASALLVCQGCGKQVLVVLSLVEVDILEAAGVLHRQCDQCDEYSSWAPAQIEQQPQNATEPTPSLPTSLPPQPTTVPRPLSSVGPNQGRIERRVHRRLPLKLPVLVRTPEGFREVSKTENISKGGIAVCLSIALNVGQIITVICPYTEGGQNLEQRAEVRRRSIFITGQRWLYGMRYMT